MQLARLEVVARSQLDNSAEYLSHISLQLGRAQNRADFPIGQIPRWLWLASQFRLSAEAESIVAAKAAAALHFLEQVIDRPELSTEDIQDLNWVLESTVRILGSIVGPADLRGCLSEDELARIDDYLVAYEDEWPFDIVTIEIAVEMQMRLLLSFVGVGDIASLDTKVAILLEAATREGTEYTPARAALRYLANVEDVVCDRSGVLGLIDDIYVIEWAYAAVESQTRCLPLLEAMLRRWPFVASTGLAARGQPLDRYAQYVSCATLFTLFGSTSGVLVLRETGAFPMIASVAAGLEAARLQSENFAEELELWKDNDPVTISDGTTTFHAVFAGTTKIGGQKRYKLHVADSGTISVSTEILPYISRSSRRYKRLSQGRHILGWLKDRNVDSLTHLTGSGKRRPERYQAILLVGPRWKLDEYLNLITPFGATPPTLLGARWIDAQGNSVDLSGSATDRPLLYACADPSVASDLVADPPEYIASWRIVVDGARAGRTLHAALSTSSRIDQVSLCVLAELHEREATEGLCKQGLRNLWYLEDQDVTVPPTAHAGKSREANPLARFLGRQSNHWVGTQTLRSETNDFLEAVADWLENQTSQNRDDPALQALDLSVATFLRRVIGQPLSEENKDTERLINNVLAQASVLAVYDVGAQRLRELFVQFLAGDAKIADRRAPLTEIANCAPKGETMAVVCRSSPIASRCCELSRGDVMLERFDWLTVEALRRAAPYDRVVIPGWLDRQAMREISANGYGAQTELLLLPFEHRWYERVLAAARRWERRLEHDTALLLRHISDTALAAPTMRWREQTRRRMEVISAPAAEAAVDDEPHTDFIEARAVEALVRALPHASDNHTYATAQLVLFDDPGTYALLPPQGQVIALQIPQPAPNQHRKVGSAERQLLISVSALEPGMLLALPETTDRDLIDARADQLLPEAHNTRAAADCWKRALKRHIDSGEDSFQSFARRMAEAGEPRDAATIRSWAGDTRSIAPRSFRRVVPLLATLTGDNELSSSIPATLAAIDQIYRARAQAAELLLQEIFSNKLDLSGSRLALTVGGHPLSFGLHRVERCAGLRDVPADLIGRAARFSETAMARSVVS